MKRIGLLIGFLTVLVFLLPSSGQDVKKDADKKDAAKKDDKKDPEKKDAKDPEKKDAKDPDPEKKDEKKKPPEKLVYGTKFVTKILGLKGESNREYTIETQEIDPNKVADMQKWSATRQQQLAQQYAQALQQKDFKARAQALQNWQRDSAGYQQEMAKRQTQLTSPKQLEIRATDNAKVRSMTPPIEFDDQGFQKKWTKKELDELRTREKSNIVLYQGDSRVGPLPGFPSDLDGIKQGQYVEIYLPKVAPAAKGAKKKGPSDDDPPAVKTSPEFVLIVILQDGK